MKISAKQYAQVLLEITDGKDKKEIEKIVIRFVETLKKNNHLAQEKKIIYYFNNLYNKYNNVIEAKVITKNSLSKKLLEESLEYLSNIDKTKILELETETKKDIIGGVVVKYGDKILDNSLKIKLNQLKTSLLK
jgi:F-type H+-transporting ATPase subunit delta